MKPVLYNSTFLKASLYVLLSFLLAVQYVWGAEALTGGVIDATTGRPLHGANVLVEELRIGAATDSLGHFLITAVLAGEYTVSASMIGYQVAKQQVSIPEQASVEFLLQPMVLPGQEVIVTGGRARRRETPIPFTDLSRERIEESWTTQDIPMMLETLPGIYSWSDAGNGVGYTALKLRGFDQRRINVSIDGVPLNDPEDHNVYWIDVPNLLANVADIQVQRGVGISLQGRNAFGGSVNLVTTNFPDRRRFGVEIGAGSYNTRKFSLDFLSGLIENSYSFYARFSRITSDGYRHDAWSELWSYFLSGVRYGRKTTMKLNVYGGPERAHAAWDPSPESELASDHKHNPYSYYENETDNFNQPHYEFHHEWRLGENLTLRNTLFYIHGEGYYEQLKFARKMKDFAISPFTTTDPGLFGKDSVKYYEGVDLDDDGEDDVLFQEDGQYALKRTDLVRQKWVIKDQYGWVPTLTWEFERGTVTAGGEVSTFESDHFGKVLWAKYVSLHGSPEDPYYRYDGKKFWISPFVQVMVRPLEGLSLLGELQYQYKTYSFMQREAGNFTGELRNAYDVTYGFFHPRLGINYNINPKLNTFLYIGKASREPSDDDLFDVWDGPDDLGVQPLFEQADTVRSGGGIDYLRWSDPRTKPEGLLDLELGVGYHGRDISVDLTLYQMMFDNEIVPYGGVDDDGEPIKGNADVAIHGGIEIEGSLQLPLNLTVAGNIAASQNYYQKFIYHDYGGKQYDFSGNTIPLFPLYLVNLWARYQLKSLTAILSLRSVGSQYLDNTQDEARIVDPYNVANFDLSWEGENLWGLQGLGVHFKVNNLLNTEYETTGYWDYERCLYPAADRNYFVTVSASL
ncbi:MAG: TonB-dependent receptor [Candidatus Neomarinimicrobiota bacterium]